MDNFIKRIFEGKWDAEVHSQFRRFSKGTFEHRALLDINKGKNSTKIKASYEFAKEMALKLAETIEGKTKVTGGIITVQDIRDDLPFEPKHVKQFQGVKTFELDGEMSKEDIHGLCDKFPNAVVLLSFKTDYGALKCKVKSPKSGKPGKGDEKPKADFCTFTSKDESILADFAFGVSVEKKCFIEHTFVIEKIEVPEEYKDDFKKAREHGLRVGKIIRIVSKDENVSESEFALRA